MPAAPRSSSGSHARRTPGRHREAQPDQHSSFDTQTDAYSGPLAPGLSPSAAVAGGGTSVRLGARLCPDAPASTPEPESSQPPPNPGTKSGCLPQNRILVLLKESNSSSRGDTKGDARTECPGALRCSGTVLCGVDHRINSTCSLPGVVEVLKNAITWLNVHVCVGEQRLCACQCFAGVKHRWLPV